MTAIDEELAEWRKHVDSKLLHLEGGHARISDGLQENTKLTREVKESVDKLVVSLGPLPDFIREGQTTSQFLKKIYLMMKWILLVFVIPLTILYVIVFGFLHHGNAPEWAKTIWQIWKNIGA